MRICLIYSTIMFTLSMILFIFSLKFIMKDLIYMFEISLTSMNSMKIEMAMLFDWMTLLFMSFVLFISSMIVYYSESYMEGELNLNRFIILIILFVVSMMLLIISPNLISILLGWDGLGLVSYCLVIFYQNVKSFNAGMLTVLSNRVGDVMLLLAIAWMLNYGSWNYIFYMDLMKNDSEMLIISLLVLLAAFTKSAQVPFSSWLPAAMAAPTPVSALVHSSTLVTAGVYLLIRFNLLISYNFSLILLSIGLITMFMSGLAANYEFDLKKIIALSTLSQLGLMMSILSLGAPILAFYHLLIHALFKALLFMCAGSFIHNMNNTQDIRYMGGMILKMPLTMTYFNISNLSLCGMLFFSGFYSKDLIVEFLSFTNFNLFIYLFFYLCIGLTVSYSFRLSYYLSLGDFNFYSLNMINDESKKMIKSMGMMLVVIILSGSLMNWIMFDIPYMINLPFFMKILTLLIILISIWLGLEISKMSLSFNLWSMQFINKYKFFSLMWNMPYISTLGLNYLFLKSGEKLIKFMDQGWSEYIGSQNLFNIMKNYSISFQYFFNNNFKIYLILITCWMMVIMIFFMF